MINLYVHQINSPSSDAFVNKYPKIEQNNQKHMEAKQIAISTNRFNKHYSLINSN